MSRFPRTKDAAFSILRMTFRLLPMPTLVRDRLRQRFLDRFTQYAPPKPYGKPPDASHTERRARTHAAGRAIGYQSWRKKALPERLPATVIAFYLPQYHPIPENDAWWGKGFTEWHNVSRALPQFEGHVQPRLPGELGFYDLRVADVLRQQMQLARDYGVGAFCTYFYWFAGKTLLEAPLQQWLADATLDLPICLCWANENWSRRWNGHKGEMLIGQQHSADDDIAFIQYVSRYLTEPRYVRIGGKPLLLLYRPALLPNPKATAERWRDWCRSHGIGEIVLAYVQSFDRVDPRDIGFDAAVSFPPNNVNATPITASYQLINPAYKGDIYDWRELVRDAVAQPDPAYPLYPCVNPGWDNEPRRSGAGRVFTHASPRGYQQWLRHAIKVSRRRTPSAPLVFVNAWNEWAEGAMLEPDTRLGCAWLEATRSALCDEAGVARANDRRPCAVIHVWYVELLDELIAALKASEIEWRIIITTTFEREDAVREHVSKRNIDAEIDVFENRGRDILPFLQVANRLLDEGVDIVLKLHTKRSTHRRDGERWRKDLTDKLLARTRAKKILAAFEHDSALGMVGPEGHLLLLNYYWGANESNVQYLINRLGIPNAEIAHDQFIAGSMYWVRLDALRPLLDANLNLSEFEDEAGQVDGTMAHAVERVMGLATAAVSLRISDSASICGLTTYDASAAYPYARRSD